MLGNVAKKFATQHHEFIVTPNITYLLFENTNALTRRIYTDGRSFPKEEEPTFAGTSTNSRPKPPVRSGAGWLDEFLTR